MSRREEEDVFNNEPIEVVLGGRQFEFREPGNRVRRAWLAKLRKIEVEYSLERIAEDDGLIFASFDAMLDFLYLVIPKAGDARIEIDNAATEEEITVAFRQVGQVIADPFLAWMNGKVRSQESEVRSQEEETEPV